MMADRWVFHIPKRESLVLCLLRSHFFTLNIMLPHCRRILNLCLFQGLTVKNITQSIMQCEYLPISTVLESNTKTHDDFSIIKVLFKLACFFFSFFLIYLFLYFALLILVMHDFWRKTIDILFCCNKIWNVFCTFLSIHISGLKPNSLAFFPVHLYMGHSK